MDQTTLNQFFVTRKSSFTSSLPPAKRTKLDAPIRTENRTEKRGRKKRETCVKKDVAKAKTTAQKRCLRPDEKIFNLFNAKPVEGKTKPVGRLSINEQGKISGNMENSKGDIDVFTAVKHNTSEVIEIPTTPKKTPLKECIPKCNQLPVNDDLNDQAKTILYSRGSAILKAGYDKNLIKSPSKASEVLNLLSPKKTYASKPTLDIIGSPSKAQFKSPTKLSDVLSALSPLKGREGREHTLKSPPRIGQHLPSKDANNSVTPPRCGERLRNKFKLLTGDGEEEKSASKVIQQGNTEVKQHRMKSPPKIGQNLNILCKEESEVAGTCVVPSRRGERLRNKFKHLTGDGGQEKSASKDIQQCSSSEIQGEVMTQKAADRFKNLVQKDSPVESPSQIHEQHSVKEKASERFKHLAQKEVPSGFVLPKKFKILIEMFRCVDSILFLLHQRSEVCTFEKLKRAVQEMCSRNFEQDHLAAMKTVLPNAFVFRQEKGLCSLTDVSKSLYQLTIEANFKEHLTSNSSKVTSHILITRRLQFEKKLLDIVKVHHQKFLRKLNIKICDSEIHRWHANFNLNDVPDIELSAIPQAPMAKMFASAADLITSNRGRFVPKVENALLSAANKTRETESKDIADVKTQKVNKPVEQKVSTNAKLKGVSSSLLERIRQKEQTKMQLAMTRDPAKEERLTKLQRLPEVCRILKSYFTTERKVAITLEDCVQKMSESYFTSVGKQKLEEHIILLAELVPEWLTIAKVRKFPFVKLAKNYDINKVINTLNDIQTKESET